MTSDKPCDTNHSAGRRQRQPSLRATLAGAVMCLCLIAAGGVSVDAGSDSNDTQPPKYEGSFDKLAVDTLGGWAIDLSQPTKPVKVEVYDGSTLLGTVLADGYREDLKTAGKGDGRHAFNYALPVALRDGASHTISVRYAGTTTNVPGSPKTLLFPKS